LNLSPLLVCHEIEFIRAVQGDIEFPEVIELLFYTLPLKILSYEGMIKLQILGK